MDSTRLHRDYFRWLQRMAPNYDVILMRYNASDPMQGGFIKDISTPVFLVHHTLEVPELMHSYRSCDKWIRVALERFSERRSANAARGIVAVTEEILDYERHRTGNPRKHGYVYPNGIHYPAQPGTLPQDERTNQPEILFVASHFAHWHGLDLLLDSIERSSSRFILHLAGTLNPQDQARAARDDRIHLHGLLRIEEIQALSQRCWLGLSSFALERKDMGQACTLKVREYLLNGLPVYANYRDVFPDGFAYYRSGPPDIEQILRYGQSIRSTSRCTVAEAARPFISKSALLLGLHTWLRERMGTAPTPTDSA